VGTRISTRPDQPWDPATFLCNGYRVFPGGKSGRGVLLTTHPLLVPRSWTSTCTQPLGHTGPVTGSLYLFLPTVQGARQAPRAVCTAVEIISLPRGVHSPNRPACSPVYPLCYPSCNSNNIYSLKRPIISQLN